MHEHTRIDDGQQGGDGPIEQESVEASLIPAGGLESIVDKAVAEFAHCGFEAAKLDTIAAQAGVSKRMLHYHFGDKCELYKRALNRAVESFTPPQDFLERSYAVPVEGIRRFVDAIFHVVQRNPDVVSLIVRENLDPVLDYEESHRMLGESEVILQIERLLLLGQDVGAFRPGITAIDLLVLVSSISFFRTTNARTVLYYGNLNLLDPRNTEGLRRLAIDTALTFLTSNIPYSGYDSYLAPSGPAASRDSESDEDDYIAEGLSDVYSDPAD
ncbi:TetR/AcrR family transcriptional regulator [Corynebacterium aquatimens]|uniref:TetR/AcrR family transcriptional regulator n=1 Tax=Corynebacterium aquatimens TaxID=1190508 RepID=A0A931DXZ5_9CORY|nr:TetR/AcrR family transcriptional regulator [Corynebacterium aquatimens]MBG6122180.1 TetR/AcrR family transcriptional regulator [Corynebacterium aquatimens]WJY65279.1 HTH-type transcriptional repressor NicS [Corynebacterium aquatimens]